MARTRLALAARCVRLEWRLQSRDRQITDLKADLSEAQAVAAKHYGWYRAGQHIIAGLQTAAAQADLRADRAEQALAEALAPKPTQFALPADGWKGPVTVYQAAGITDPAGMPITPVTDPLQRGAVA